MLEKKSMVQKIVLCCFAILLGGCAHATDDNGADNSGGDTDTDTDAGDTNESLDGDPTTLTEDYLSIGVTVDGEAFALVDGTSILLEFDNGDLSASAGCNSMFGTCSLVDGQLVVSQMSTTMKGCDSARQEQDQWLTTVLEANPVVVVDGDILTLTATLDNGSEVVITLQEEEVAVSDLPLVGTLWTVDTVYDGEMASTSNWQNPATITFNSDNTVDVFTGCNSGSGTYTLDGNTITVTGLAVTEMACDDQMTMELEQTVLELLGNNALEMEIDQHRLDLMAGNAGLGLNGSAE